MTTYTPPSDPSPEGVLYLQRRLALAEKGEAYALARVAELEALCAEAFEHGRFPFAPEVRERLQAAGRGGAVEGGKP